MTFTSVRGVAFAMPGGDAPGRPGRRPIDMGILSRQTMEDRALEREVLALFAHQAVVACKALRLGSEDERRRVAHGLKGSAAAIGALPIADCAEAIEEAPANAGLLRRLEALVDEARDFIAAINR